jgi:ABC-2 type transport system permease protein
MIFLSNSPGGIFMNNRHNILQMSLLIAASFREIIREPGVLFWGIGFPILMSLGLGIAFIRKPAEIRRIAVVTSPEFVIQDTMVVNDKQLGSTMFIFDKMSWEEALVLLKRGSFNLILDQKEGQIQYHFDPRNPDAQLCFLKLSRLLQGEPEVLPENTGQIQPLTVTGTRYIDFFIPGILSMGVMMSCMWGLSYGLIEKRSKKLLRRMVATPMKKSYFLLSMITVRIGMNFIESFFLVLFAWLVFGINIHLSLSALLLIFLAGNFAFAGLAVFVSSRTANTEVGNGFINAIVFPMMILSGIFFSYHNFPDWAIPVIQLLPLTMLADGVRSIFIEDAGLIQVAQPILILTAVGAFFFTAGLKVFRWY